MPEFEVNPPVPCSICGELKEPEELSDLDGQLACLDCIAQANVSKNVPLEKLEAWLKGEETAPLEAFLGSLDVIADGPYALEGRPIRVAAIREPR